MIAGVRAQHLNFLLLAFARELSRPPENFLVDTSTSKTRDLGILGFLKCTAKWKCSENFARERMNSEMY